MLTHKYTLAMHYFLPFTFLFIFFFADNVYAQLATYSSSNTSGTGASGAAANVNAVGFSRGTGISQNTGSTFNSRGFDGTDFASAKAAGDVIKFSLSPASGYKLSLSGLNIRYDRSGSGPQNVVITIEPADLGFPIQILTDAVSSSGENQSIDLSSFAGLDNITSTVFIELFPYGASSTGGTFDIETITSSSLLPTNNLGISNIGAVVFGTVTAILPIELDYFAAKTSGDHVHVNWQTSTELNNDYMEVQRSRNGKDFITIEKVAGAGTTDEPQDYSFVDKTPLPGISYYRLKQVDYDGAFEIHRTEMVQRKTTQWEVQAVPTQVSDQLTLYSSEVLNTETTYEVINMNGQVVQSGAIDLGVAEMQMNVGTLASGTYLMKLQNTNEFTVTRFMKW